MAHLSPRPERKNEITMEHEYSQYLDPEYVAKLIAPVLDAITIFDLAVERGLKTQPDGSCSGQDFYDVGLEYFGGCRTCGASIAAYNAYPSKDGYWRCKDHIGPYGWTDAKQANADIFGGTA
jgi:hypothetical protein